MAKKTRPRWCDDGVGEVSDFALNSEQARALAAALDITQQQEIDRLADELNDVGRCYLRWSDQDEKGPTRAERNAALKEVLAASRRLEMLLKALDHASEANLMDSLAPYRRVTLEFDEDGNITDTPKPRESGFRQIQALRARLTHLNMYAGPYLRRQLRRRGPEARKTLPAIIDILGDIYECETGERLTHTPVKGTEYKSGPQSKSGQFIAAFIKIVDPLLPPSAASSALVQVVSARKSRTKKVHPPIDGDTIS